MSRRYFEVAIGVDDDTTDARLYWGLVKFLELMQWDATILSIEEFGKVKKEGA